MDQEKLSISTTTDGNPPAPGFETASAPGPIKENGQHTAYWVLSEDERKKGFVRPVRTAYQHLACGTVTTMGLALSETYARDPNYYGATFCCHCRNHFALVGPDGNRSFVWTSDGAGVGV